MTPLRIARLQPPTVARHFNPLAASPSYASCSRIRLRYAQLSFVVARSVSIPSSQTRFQSSFQSRARGRPEEEDADHQHAPPPPPPPPSIRRILLSLVRFEGLRRALRGQSWRTLFRQNPEEFVLAVVILIAATGIVAYIARVYFTYFYHEQFTRYPEPIAKALRRALYYSNYKPDPKLALKYYKAALELCDEYQMDYFSDDVMGIKIQLAAWLEKIHSFEKAAVVLETLLTDCRRWVDTMEDAVRRGKATDGLLRPFRGDGGPVPERPGDADAVPETLWGKRTRVLAKAVAISVKLGEIYSDEHVLKRELGHERLTWAVETALKELQRRTTEGPEPGEGEWMNAEAIGGALESLAHSYESKSQFHLAVPLFFQAMKLCQDPCHIAVLMNNLATSYAQHPILAPSETPLNEMLEQPLVPATATPQEVRASYLAAARRWATHARQHASEPTGARRTAECDEACAASLCTLGDVASLAGDADQARRWFEQALAASRKVGFEPGAAQAEKGLRALAVAGSS